MPTRRAVLSAAIPGVIVCAVFWIWIGVPLPAALAAGLLWSFGSLLVTRFLYDDAEGELAAWRAEAPDLAVGIRVEGQPPEREPTTPDR